jgi:uncharacterized protein (TIGR00369 family)
MANLNPKPISHSRVTLSQLMQPAMANLHGNVHGGMIMKLVDEAGALACMRHSQQRVVTVSIDQMTFRHPIRLGDLVTFNAEVSFVGRTSMEVEVNVFAENVRNGKRWHTNTAYLVYVALDDQDQPCPVPPLVFETEEEKTRAAQAKKRQAHRLAQRNHTPENDG